MDKPMPRMYDPRVQAEIERLQRENAQLQKCVRDWIKQNAPGGWIDELRSKLAAAELDRDAWVEQHHNRTKLIDELQAKLAAAEADTKRLDRLTKWFTNADWLHIHNCFMIEKPLREAVDYFAAIEDKKAAKTGVIAKP